MLNNTMLDLGSARSAIRELYEQGKILKQKYGDDKVFDFSIGNPIVPCPSIVNEKLTELINGIDPVILHGYTSAQGNISVRESISNYLNQTYNAKTDKNLIYISSGAAAALAISLKALTDGSGDNEVIIFTP